LWVTYIVLLGPLVALAVFGGDELVETVWTRPSSRQFRGNVKGIIALLFILLGPIILLVRQFLLGTRRPSDHPQQNRQPDAVALGNWRFRPLGSLVLLAIVVGITGLGLWAESHIPGLFAVAYLLMFFLFVAVGVLVPFRNLVFYPPSRPPLRPVGPGKQQPPKAEPGVAVDGPRE
jgi:hypothetical protein